MWWSNIIIVLFLLELLLVNDINGNANRRRRRRRQTSGSLYGTNSNLGASAPSGYNYPETFSIQGTRLNNADARDLYGNPIISYQSMRGPLTSLDLNGQPKPQQNQIYGNNDQSGSNSLYGANSFYSGSNTNQLLRDPNGNLIMRGINGNPIQQGSMGSSFYSSSDTQMAYPANPNQVLTNKDSYGTLSNTNTNQYGYSNNNALPNSNTYGGPMGGNSYTGQIGGTNNLVPNSNTYSGYMGTNANQQWPNQNSYNPYTQNSGNGYYPNRNSYYYGNGSRLTISCFIIFLSFFVTIAL